MGVGFLGGFIAHLQLATTNNYNSLTDLYALQITVTTAHVKSVCLH
jgi:hypothetical protein